MCMRTVDVVINMYTIVSQLINMKGKVMRYFHLYEDIVNYTLCSMRFICDMGWIFIAGATLGKCCR